MWYVQYGALYFYNFIQLIFQKQQQQKQQRKGAF